MSNQRSHRNDSPAPPAYDTTRLVVRGDRRAEPDWDLYVAILLSHSLQKAGLDDLLDEEPGDG
jgi:hypothetical protein